MSTCPAYKDYEECIPPENRWMLNEKIDFNRGGVDLHLTELGRVLENWGDIAPVLELDSIAIGDIRANHPLAQGEQRVACLKKWKSRKAFKATYGKLLDSCLRTDNLMCAERIVMLLGATGPPSLNIQAAIGRSSQVNTGSSQVNTGSHQPQPAQVLPPQPQPPLSQAVQLQARQLQAGQPQAGQLPAGQPHAVQLQAGQPQAGQPQAGQPQARQPQGVYSQPPPQPPHAQPNQPQPMHQPSQSAAMQPYFYHQQPPYTYPPPSQPMYFQDRPWYPYQPPFLHPPQGQMYGMSANFYPQQHMYGYGYPAPPVSQQGIPRAPHIHGPGSAADDNVQYSPQQSTSSQAVTALSGEATAVAAAETSESHLPIYLAPENQYTPVKSDGIAQYEAKPRGQHRPMLKLSKSPKVAEPILAKPFRQDDSQIGYYDMTAKLHGAAFIFNNKTFLQHEERKGTERDEENLIQTVAYLGYRPVVFRDLTSSQMLSVFEKIDKYLKESDDGAKVKVAHDSFICCILSHGNRGSIIGKDSISVKRESIERAVGESKTLNGRPKIFFIQACQGDDPGTEPVLTVHADGGKTTSKRAHIYVCSATTFGDKAYRDEFLGSWFVVEVCKILCQFGKCYKLSDFQNHLNKSVATNESYRCYDKKGIKHTQQTTGGGQLYHDVHFFDGGD